MPNVVQTEAFADWLGTLRDRQGRAKILDRIVRLERGNPGDVRPIGGGLSEMRIDFGPGYRVYFGTHRQVTVVLLCGGDKSTQAADIKTAKRMFGDWKDAHDG
jgi:putative addiction module killer protein